MGAAVASVVPAVENVISRTIPRYINNPILHIDYTLELGVEITYPRPDAIGADRLANASAALSRYGAPVVVADFGTALTFDVIVKPDGYIGGIICPGLPLMFSYLADKTALLPNIEPGPIRHTVGKNTTEAMRIGARWGYRGMVREILENLEKSLGVKGMRICATGGYASWVLKGLDMPVTYDKELTLYGIGRIYMLNQDE